MPARNEIEIIIKGDDKASGVLDSTRKRLGALKDAGEDLASSLGSAGKSLVALTAPFVAGMGYSVKTAVDFDESMTNVGAVLGLTRDEMADLNDQVLDIGRNSRAGPQAAADAFYDIVGGVADASAHMAILNAAIQTAEAGNADLGGATSALISIMNSYKFEAEDAARVSDILTATVGAGVGTMDQFAAALPQVTGLANSLKIDLADLAAATAYLTTQGNTASQATTQLAAMMTAALNPNASMKEALKELGFESGQAAVEQLGLVGAMNAISGTQAVAQNGMAATVGSVEALRGVTALAGESFTQFSNDFVTGVNGATAAAQTIQLDSAAAQFDLLQSQMGALTIEIGTALLPAFISIVNEIKPIITQLAAWAQANPQTVQQIAVLIGAAVALGGGLSVLSGIFSGVTAVVGIGKAAWALFNAVIAITSAPLYGVGAAATAVIGPIGAMVAPIAAVTAAAIAAVAALKQLIEFHNQVQASAGAANQALSNYVASGGEMSRADLEERSFNSIANQMGGGIVGDVAARLFYTNVANSVQGDTQLPARAAGGPVTAGSPYMVGERGPELFVPRESGNIVANNDMGMNVSLQINVNSVDEIRPATTNALDAIRDRQRMRGAVG